MMIGRKRSNYRNGPVGQLVNSVVVAGFGSPFGDDRVGWRVVELLRASASLAARLFTIAEGTQLIHALDGCKKLIVVDGCRAGLSVGNITQLTWPDPRIRQFHNHSTHSLGVFNALELAGQLEQLPADVEIFGIEVGKWSYGDSIDPKVERAAVEVASTILPELNERFDA